MVARWAYLLFSVLLLAACRNDKITEIKDFKIFVDSDRTELQESVSFLADRYNNALGLQALSVVSSQSDSNSVIHFESNLHLDGQKLGLGQWITTSSHRSHFNIPDGEQVETQVVYGMEISFDLENFENKLPRLTLYDSDESTHLFHLFCHEIGHGMQLSHVQDANDVMYPSIPDHYTRSIDFAKYFAEIRAFLNAG